MRMDPHHLAKISPAFARRYRKAGVAFCDWMVRHRLSATTIEEIDDLLVEFKNGEKLTVGQFSMLVASLEFFHPRCKGKLALAHQALAGWERITPVRHTVPLCPPQAKLVGVYLSVEGHPRLGLGVQIQVAVGMRPGELLGIHMEHVTLPEDLGLNPSESPIVIGLGVKVGTKVGRAQAALLRPAKHNDECRLLRCLMHACSLGERLFPYSNRQYNRLLKNIESR